MKEDVILKLKVKMLNSYLDKLFKEEFNKQCAPISVEDILLYADGTECIRVSETTVNEHYSSWKHDMSVDTAIYQIFTAAEQFNNDTRLSEIPGLKFNISEVYNLTTGKSFRPMPDYKISKMLDEIFKDPLFSDIK